MAVTDVRSHLSEMGPTWLAGAIAAGPATIASLVTAGATFGYTLLWVVVLSSVMGATAQYLAARLGLLTEAGIVSVVEEHLGEGWAWLLVADTVLASGLAQLVIMKTVAGVSAEITGTSPVVWAALWGVILAVGLAGGGYKYAETGAKVLVSLVVLLFIASLFVVPIDFGAAAAGLAPVIPAGVSGALLAAGILGGAVHITLVTMQSYTMRARGWTAEDSDLAVFDIATSMLAAFGVASLAIFLVAAAVLNDPSLGAVGAANALGPLVGGNARWLFLLGLWGAAVTTLGGNTVVPAYLIADKMDWEQDVSDNRYRVAIAATALLSIGGVFLGGAFFPLLVLVLAFGLVGTPFALALVLYLLNDPQAVPETNSVKANLGGVALITITIVTAGSWLRGQVQSGVTDPLTIAVLVFAAILSAAMLGLVAMTVQNWLADDPDTAMAAD